MRKMKMPLLRILTNSTPLDWYYRLKHLYSHSHPTLYTYAKEHITPLPDLKWVAITERCMICDKLKCVILSKAAYEKVLSGEKDLEMPDFEPKWLKEARIVRVVEMPEIKLDSLLTVLGTLSGGETPESSKIPN